MGILRWSMQAQWKFTLVWTLFQSVWGVLIFAVALAASTGLPIEALFVAASMPIAGLMSAPIMWRVLVMRQRKAQEHRRTADDDKSR